MRPAIPGTLTIPRTLAIHRTLGIPGTCCFAVVLTSKCVKNLRKNEKVEIGTNVSPTFVPSDFFWCVTLQLCTYERGKERRHVWEHPWGGGGNTERNTPDKAAPHEAKGKRKRERGITLKPCCSSLLATFRGNRVRVASNQTQFHARPLFSPDLVLGRSENRSTGRDSTGGARKEAPRALEEMLAYQEQPLSHEQLVIIFVADLMPMRPKR